jgi:Holliday junction resolvase RusA-like endonuclease
MSHGIRVEDIAWQAFQAGRGARDVDLTRESFIGWWTKRRDQGCALPACERCGYDPSATVSATWTIGVDRDPPSLNARIVNAGWSRFRYARERDAWCWEFRAARLMLNITPATGRRRVTMTRIYAGRQKERDRDNLAGGMKVVVDAMVSERLLVNDDPRNAEIHYQQEHGGPPGLRVLIEELSC